MELIKLDHKEFGLEEIKASEISAQFKPMLDKMVELEKEANKVFKLDIEDPESAKVAKELRLKYVKVRTGTADIHKKQKAFYLAGGRFVDAWKNTQGFASQGIEEKLMAIEKHAERIEEDRKEKLRIERAELLEEYGVNPEHIKVEDMELEVWENYFSGVKLQHEQKIAAEKKAEEERVAKEKAEAEERERVRKENERLKKEAEAKEKELEKERAEVEAEKKAAAEKAEKERQEIEAKAKKDREEAEAKAKEEREIAEEAARLEAEAKEKVEKELQEAKDAEAKRLADEEESRQLELAKGDEAKYNDLINELETIGEKYVFKADKFKDSFDGCRHLLTKVITYLESKK